MTVSNVMAPIRITSSNAEFSDKDLELINRHTLKPLTREDVFVYEGICSSDALDSYDTRMDPITTLRNFADDLIIGTALMEGHNTDRNPYGRSFDAEIIEKDGITSVRGRWYIPRGVTINSVSTDDTIRAIETGVLRDMSVGFGGPDMWYKCSVDGKDLWDTPYFPGDTDEDGNRVFFWIVDARLREVSTVYKGACPDAYIEKVRSEISDGSLKEKQINMFEERYQTRFERDSDAFLNTKKSKRGSDNVNVIEELKKGLKDGSIERSAVRTALEHGGHSLRSQEDTAIRNELGEDLATVEAIRNLKKDAGHGRKYVEDLVEDAVKERVAVQGDTFNAESYKVVLERSGDIDYIKSEIESYRKMKGDKFKPGRQLGGNDDDSNDDVVVLD